MGSAAEINYLLGNSNVAWVALPDYGVTNAGLVTSEGDTIVRADEVRDTFSGFGLDGTGIKVGVISNGVANLASVAASGDLPATINVNPLLPGTSDEGTAMLEIIHDLAPGAELFFSSGISSSLAMIDSVNWLVSQGVDIIVDDLSFFLQPNFEDGAIADTVASAVASGVSYFSSAGNQALDHYQADFNLGTTITLNSVNHQVHDFGGTLGLAVNIQGDGVPGMDNIPELDVFLQWSDPFGNSSNDYNLFLVDQSFNVLSESVAVAGTQNPVERLAIDFSVAGVLTAFLVIGRIPGAADRELELFSLRDIGQLFSTPTDAIFGHQALTEINTIAAIGQADVGNDDIRDFSNHGPSTIYTNFATQTSTTRASLDGASIDGVQTRVGQLGFFNNPFDGTSAAAPHAAAIAALMLDANPTLTPERISSTLAETAIDILAPGYDPISGSGRFDALNAVIAVLPSADFNEDGDVDGGDFLAWQRNLGMTGATRADGDTNGDGVVDSDDLMVWAEQFGMGTGFNADFNNDGTVDGMDLEMWQSSFGINGNGDADGDGDTDGADFLAWQRQISTPSEFSNWVANAITFLQFMGGENQLVVSNTTDEIDGNYGLDDLSLREAIKLANNASQPTTIILPEGHYQLTLSGAESGNPDGPIGLNDLDITGNVTIIGAGAGRSIIRNFGAGYAGSHHQRHIFSADGANVHFALSGVTLTGDLDTTASDQTTNSYGASVVVQNGATFLLTDSALVNNTSQLGIGQGIASRGAHITVLRSVFTSNTGGIASAILARQFNGIDGSFTVGDSIFALNSSSNHTPNILAYAAVNVTNLGGNLYDNDEGNFFANNPGVDDHFGTPDYVVTTIRDTFNHSNDEALLSVREAVDLANNAAGIQEVWLPAWNFELTRNRDYSTQLTDTDISYGDIDISESVIIRGVAGETTIRWEDGAAAPNGNRDKVFDLLGSTADGTGDATASGADFLTFQREFGSGTVNPVYEEFLSDFDDDGDVDADDVGALWQQYFGNTLDMEGIEVLS